MCVFVRTCIGHR